MKMNIPTLLSKADMATRWCVTRQVVNNWENRHSNFPKPVMTVHNGSLPLYLEVDVLKYEQERKIPDK
jgi:hypothetical protein